MRKSRSKLRNSKVNVPFLYRDKTLVAKQVVGLSVPCNICYFNKKKTCFVFNCNMFHRLDCMEVYFVEQNTHEK